MSSVIEIVRMNSVREFSRTAPREQKAGAIVSAPANNQVLAYSLVLLSGHARRPRGAAARTGPEDVLQAEDGGAREG